MAAAAVEAAASCAREESVGSDAIVASSGGGSRAGDCAHCRETDRGESVVVFSRAGGGDGRREGAYGALALCFGAANFEIGKAWYAWVFLEFCTGAMLAAVSDLNIDWVCT